MQCYVTSCFTGYLYLEFVCKKMIINTASENESAVLSSLYLWIL